MHTIPTTPTGIIDTIIHLADIHIRNGDAERSRYNQYITTFDNLIGTIKDHPAIIAGTAVVAILGDVFHYKNQLDTTGLYLFNYLIDKLSKLCPVYIISGNHDLRQDRPNEPDVLTSIFHGAPRQNVYYMDKTSLYQSGNVTFSLVNIADTLNMGNSSGQAKHIPDFPTFPKNAEHKVVLFHGTVKNSVMQNFTLATENNSMPLSWLLKPNPDIILLGDVHLQQIHNVQSTSDTKYQYSKSSTPWGYPGSLIQQNYGEKLLYHGILLWNLKKQTVEIMNIKSPEGYAQISITDNGQWITSNGKWWLNKDKRNSYLLTDLLGHELCPDTLNLQIKSSSTVKDIGKLRKLESRFKKTLHIAKGEFQTDNSSWDFDSVDIGGLESVDHDEFNVYNKPETWITYIKEHCDIQPPYKDWTQWINDPSTLKMSLHSDVEPIKLKERNNAIEKKIGYYRDTANMCTLKRPFTLLFLEWDWLFCYGSNNWINFSDASNKICSITGNNSTGKSSIFDIISLAVFGDQIPSRRNGNMSTIISTTLTHKKARTCIYFSVGIQSFKLLRNYSLNDAGNLRDNPTLYQINPDSNTMHLLYSTQKDVAHWIVNNIGTHDNFMISSMLTQESDGFFYSLPSKAQYDILDKALGIDLLHAFQDILKEAENAHKYVMDNIITAYDTTNKHLNDIQEIPIEEVTALTKQLQYTENLLNNHQNDLRNYTIPTELDEKDLQLSDHDIQHHLSLYSPTISDQNIDQLKHELLLLNLTNSNDSVTEEYTLDIHDIPSIDQQINTLEQKYSESVNRYTQLSDNAIPNPRRSIDDYNQWSTQFKKTQLQIEQNHGNILNLKKLCQNTEETPLFTQQQLDEEQSRINSMIEKLSNKNLVHSPNLTDSKILEADLAQSEEHIQLLNNEVNSLSTHINKLTTDRDSIHLDLTKLQSYSQPNESVTDLQQWLHNYDQRSNHYLTKQKEEENINHKIQLLAELNMLQNQAKSITCKIHHDHNCNTCNSAPIYKQIENIQQKLQVLQSIDVSKHPQVTEWLQSYNQDTHLATIKKHNLELWNKYDNYILQHTKLQQLYDNVVAQISNHSDRLTDKTSKINNLQKHIASLKNQITAVQIKQHIIELKHKQEKLHRYIEHKPVVDLLHQYTQLHEQESDMIDLKQQLNDYDQWCTERNFLAKNSEKIYAQLHSLKIQKKNTLQREIHIYTQHLKWATIQKYATIYRQRTECHKNITMLQTKLHELQRNYDRQLNNNTLRDRYQNELATLKLTHESLDKRKQTIKLLRELFSKYRSWLYTHNVMPKLTKLVNKLVSYIIDDADCTLQVNISENFKGRNVEPQIEWSIMDADNISSIQTAGGYRKAIYGIAIRVAMSYLGCSNMNCRQLFLDEAFVAASNSNIEKIPDFIRGIFKIQSYQSIFMVSHQDIMKDLCDILVQIQRKGTISSVQFGNQKHDIAHITHVITTNNKTVNHKSPNNKLTTNSTCDAIVKRTGLICGKKSKPGTTRCGHHKNN